MLKTVLFLRVYTERDEHFDHFEGDFGVTDHTGCENQCLLEVLGLVNHLSHIDIELLDHAYDFIDLPMLHSLKELLVQWADRAGHSGSLIGRRC